MRVQKTKTCYLFKETETLRNVILIIIQQTIHFQILRAEWNDNTQAFRRHFKHSA